MSEARLEAIGTGRYRLSGELSFDTVPALVARSPELFAGEGEVHVDLEDVGRADSAGVALLIDWRREAELRARRISFDHVPAQMLALARVSGVDELLALD